MPLSRHSGSGSSPTSRDQECLLLSLQPMLLEVLLEVLHAETLGGLEAAAEEDLRESCEVLKTLEELSQQPEDL